MAHDVPRPQGGEIADLAGSKPFRNIPLVAQRATAEMVATTVGFSPHHAGLTWDHYDRTVEQILEDLLNTKPIRSCYLGGPVGVGKTTYLALMLKEIFLREARESQYRPNTVEVTAFLQRGVIFRTHHDLVDDMHRMLKSGEDEEMQDLYRCRILLIDDFGTGFEDERGFNIGLLERLLDYRWARCAITWMSGNLRLETLKKAHGWERIYTRLSDPKWLEYITVNSHKGADRRSAP